MCAHDGAATSLGASPNETYLVTCASDGLIKVSWSSCMYLPTPADLGRHHARHVQQPDLPGPGRARPSRRIHARRAPPRRVCRTTAVRWPHACCSVGSAIQQWAFRGQHAAPRHSSIQTEARAAAPLRITIGFGRTIWHHSSFEPASNGDHQSATQLVPPVESDKHTSASSAVPIVVGNSDEPIAAPAPVRIDVVACNAFLHLYVGHIHGERCS